MLPTHCIYTNTHTHTYKHTHLYKCITSIFSFFYIINILDVDQTRGARSQRCSAMISFKDKHSYTKRSRLSHPSSRFNKNSKNLNHRSRGRIHATPHKLLYLGLSLLLPKAQKHWDQV